MSAFSMKEKRSFEKAAAIFQPTSQTMITATDLYAKIRHRGQATPHKDDDAMMISMFMAELTQDVRDLRGGVASGMGLACSRLIKNCSSVPLLIEQTRSCMSLLSTSAGKQAELQSYLELIKFNFEYMQLFESYISEFDFQTSSIPYRRLFIETAWMFYIDCRENYAQLKVNEREENNCLLASVFYFMIRYSFEHIQPKALADSLHNCDRKMLITRILDFLLNVFQIEDIALYKQIAEIFDEYIEKRLLEKAVLKTTGIHDTDFFAPSVIQVNYKRLSNKYQKALSPATIDYRVFRPMYSISLTPIQKKTPMPVKAPVGLGGKGLQSNTKLTFMSHRVLNYEDDTIDNQTLDLEGSGLHSHCSSTSNLERNPVNLINRIHFSNSLSRLPLASTNITHNLDSKVLAYFTAVTHHSQRIKSRPFFTKILAFIQEKLPQKRQNVRQLTYSLYKSLLDSYVKSSLVEDSESVHYCWAIVALYLTAWLEKQRPGMVSILQLVSSAENYSHDQIDYVDLWAAFNYALKQDYSECANQKLPAEVSSAIKECANTLLTKLVWEKDQDITNQMAQFAANYPKKNQFNYFMQGLVLYCQDFITKVGSQLRITQDHCDYAYNCMKFILSASGDILENGRHLDQILLCSLYLAGRVEGSNTRFLDIKEAYEECFGRTSNLGSIFCNITLLKEEQKGDLINFYNGVFIQLIKPFVPYMQQPSLTLLHSLFQRQITMPSVNQNAVALTELQTSKNYSLNKMNILETTKPQHHLKNKKKEASDRKYVLTGERPTTTVRARPQDRSDLELCETEKNFHPRESREEEEGYRFRSRTHFEREEDEEYRL